jgi:hypothetical protein
MYCTLCYVRESNVAEWKERHIVDLAHAFRITPGFAKDYASALAVAQPRKLFAMKFNLQPRNKNMIINSFNRIPICNFHTHGEGDTCHLIVVKENGYGHGSRSKEFHLLSGSFKKTEEHSILSRNGMGHC